MHWHRRSTFELLACQRRQQADTNGPPLVPVVHGVETRETVAVYRTFWALLDLVDPSRFLRLEDEKPALEADPELTRPVAHQMYVPATVVFTTLRGGRTRSLHCGERQSRPCLPLHPHA